jgi:zinc transport system substrate-binding protein
MTHIKTLALAGAFVLLGVSASAAEPLKVYTDNYPVTYFAERIAGDTVGHELEIVFPVPQGVDPSFWRPSIADIGELQHADMIILNGADFATWMTKASLPRSVLVDTSQSFSDRFMAGETITHSHGAEGEHTHTATASYTWLDFSQAALQADAIAAALTRLVPDKADTFAAGLADLKADLASLDEDGEATGAAASGLHFISSHPRYQYLARAYGLEMEFVTWPPTETPSDEEWTKLQGMLDRTTKPVVMVWEAEPLPEVRQRLEDLGVRIFVFPTLANAAPGEDFITDMHDTITEFANSMMNL